MCKENLFFNILTFDYPTENPVFHFSKDENSRCHKIHKSLFPKEIDSIFPGISNDCTDCIYTTFTGEKEGLLPLDIQLDKDNPDLIKRYFNRQINYYFRAIKKQIVKVGFIKENQIWLHDPMQSTSQWNVYKKFSLKVQLETVSNYPEILLSYDGVSKVLKQSVAELIQEVSPTCYNWILRDNKLEKWEWLENEGLIDYTSIYPVLNKKLQVALNIPYKAPGRGNRYPKYLSNIQEFYNQFLDTPEFKDIIAIHEEGFLSVDSSQVNNTAKDSNLLVFGKDQMGITPKYDLKKFKPYKESPHKNIHLFFIMHKAAIPEAFKLNERFKNGFKWFRGLQQYANILFHIEEGFSITFTDKENPLPEIEQALEDRDLSRDIKYIAIYITPFGKYETNKDHREIYYKVKELLLKRNITSQAIDPEKMRAQGDDWVYSLPNIAVAILAKLGGIPWRLNTPIKNELIVGIGAFKHIEEDEQYIGSAFSFANDGKFNSFEYFRKDEIEFLAGKIANSVHDYATVNNNPDRLIIHFYKTMNDVEIQHIEKALYEMNLPIPVFILTINKTESKDIVAFDSNWKELMPKSGTFIDIGNHKYLLFNNTRYPESEHSKADGFPFPIKLKFDCTHKEQLNDTDVIRELIDQVYQFSRMYWKSIRQQNLPVTIKYPEMVAQMAPHFSDEDIPPFGKDNLWFL
jgi:hypothetical protein